MRKLKFTAYFEDVVLKKRPYLTKEMIILVLAMPLKTEHQINGRIRYWGQVVELGGRYLRVVTLADGITVHNAFLDRDFKP